MLTSKQRDELLNLFSFLTEGQITDLIRSFEGSCSINDGSTLQYYIDEWKLTPQQAETFRDNYIEYIAEIHNMYSCEDCGWWGFDGDCEDVCSECQEERENNEDDE